MIAIVDYGVGNLGSISNMLKKVGVDEIVLATTSDDIKKADKIILPGVGAFDTGMKLLNESGLRQELDIQVMDNHKPILGICLGMQMLGKGSEEGNEAGLGYIDFKCYKFNISDHNLHIPHMGWDYVEINKEVPLTRNPKEKMRFYFVHSYYAECEDKNDILFSCDYGITFAAGVNKKNVYGVQFHPEKSHNYGKWLIKNFTEI
ncbi:imidazole glycerol phosphate synthase subunit HisH [Butyrivibrio sp. CB08]|uniref:imidazole glycerol phosphate synthase subunit HisH n=1 Tax=Butyrivibrio sp. CB08 TaxID=2364879 RepID=UPI000EA880BD|nr:imidazole glycerol phosphate synthase subunit HisH [Butyrivibrio sp. CB08]RKM57893.1 imidazole glycerol phosphate synthase subunit HisH [Butyrivibrio sp. CB08]